MQFIKSYQPLTDHNIECPRMIDYIKQLLHKHINGLIYHNNNNDKHMQ